MSALFALLLAQAAPQVAPDPAVQTPAVAPTRDALALDLAELLNSEALTRAQLAKIVAETLPKVFAQNPDMVSIEKEHPGASAAVIAAIGPEMVTYTVRTLPELWRNIAPIYARHLDVAELRALLAFYRGATGQRVITAMGRGSDYGAALSRMMNEQSSTMTASDLRAGAAPGISEVIRTSSPEDRQAMIALGQSSAGRKLPAVTREVMEAVSAQSAKSDPAFEKRIETLTIDTLTKFISKR